MKFMTLAATLVLSTLGPAIAVAATDATTYPSETEIKINDVKFVYRVLDNGLRTSGQVFPGPAKFESIRTLVLQYQALSVGPASMRTDLFTDARSKCNELGDTELANQSKGMTNKFVIRGSAGLVSSQVDEMNPPQWGHFFCRVTVTAEETSK